MPKETQKPSPVSSKQTRSQSHPYAKNDECTSHVKFSEHEKELWNKTCCPICLDPPHNPVLLVCSSSEKGCRPVLCNTSPILSNCLDQFRKSSSSKGQTCPLCRGSILRYADVSDQAFRYMNSKIRNCSNEGCEFSGTYDELLGHAKTEHVGKIAEVAVPSVSRPVLNVRRGARMSTGGYFPMGRQLAPRAIASKILLSVG